jgi:hypothetical protein
MPQKRSMRHQKENVGVGKANESPPRDNQVPPKETSLIEVVKRRGGTSSSLWDSFPK